MTVASIRQRSARPIPREPAEHLFKIGQAVRLRGGYGTVLKATNIYRITGTLPPRGDSPQYRIRNDDERHERVARQDELEPAVMSSGGDAATLTERTFGHGQGTEAQQSRDQKAEAGKAHAQA